DGKPKLHKSGYAKIRQIFDARGRVIERAELDLDDSPIVQGDLPQRTQYEYDDNDQIIRTIYLDDGGREIPIDVIILNVFPGSVAERVQLQPGDRIVTYDGKRPVDVRSFVGLVVSTTGSVAPRVLVVRRDAKLLTFEVPSGRLGVEVGAVRA